EASVGIDINFDGVADLMVDMIGTTEVFRGAAIPGFPPRRGFPRHRDHLQLEIFAMTLSGSIPGLGPLTLRAGDGLGNLIQDGPLYSPGVSDEVSGNPRLADDLFDIFFTVEFQGVALHNTTPLRVTGQIDRLPPIGTRFAFSGPPLVLVNAAGTPV